LERCGKVPDVGRGESMAYQSRHRDDVCRRVSENCDVSIEPDSGQMGRAYNSPASKTRTITL
jgi:hypothetical protein